MDTSSAYYYFVGWAVIFLAAWGMTKAEGTRTILYYLIILAIVLDLVTHAQELQDILSKAGFQTTIPNTNSNQLNTTAVTPLR
jgi:hypothetical protein